jgi:hypothetical protein
MWRLNYPPACAYDTPVPPAVPLRRFALAPLLVVACGRGPNPPVLRDRPDATVRADVPSTARLPDATPDAPYDAGPLRPLLSVYVVGGGGMVREGSPVQIRVVRHRGGADGDVEVTATAAVRVEPLDRGDVDATRVFRGRGRGRLRIYAAQGGDEAWTLVDVSNDLPAGTNVIPTLQASGGLVPLSVRFESRQDGTVWTLMEFVNRSLTLEGRRVGRTFPITVPVRAEPLLPDPSRPVPLAGVLVLDRWANGRLDAHAALRLDGRPVQVRFTVQVADVTTLTGPVLPSP